MGLFSRNTINESYDSPNSIMNESIETPSIYDGKYDFTMESAYRIVAENDCNYTAIMKAVGINELAAFENGEEFFINEAGGFFTSIVNFLKNVWEKIKGIFRKFIATFDSYAKSDADFIKKYKSYITKSGVLKDFKYQGFKFNVPDSICGDLKGSTGAYTVIDDTISGAVTFEDNTSFESLLKDAKGTKQADLDAVKTKINDNWDDDIVPKIRSIVARTIFGNSLKISGSVEAEELSNELFEFFRSGDSTKQTLEESDIDIMKIISHLTNSATVKKGVNKTFKELQKWFDGEIKKIDKISNSSLKAMPGEKAENVPDDFKSNNVVDKESYKTALDYVNFWSQTTSRAYSVITSVMTVCQNAWLKALNDRSRQEKAICVALVNRGTNVKSYGESYSFENENSSYLGNVKLI